ncbi:MAG: hypothetical protein Q8K42_02870, partial [Methylobacter sp.]|nr:hypothetical protein [Methylobacter sp.]
QPETASMAVDKPLTSDTPRSSAIASVSPKTPALEALPPDPTSRDGENAARLPGAVAAMPSSARSLPLGTEQEKSKQLELSKALSKTIDPVEPPIAQNSEIKAQSEPVKAVEGKKQSDVAQQKMADRLWASREKLKQTELKKTVNSMEPFKPNQLETIQIPQKPVEVAGIPEQRVMETAAPQQVEPGRIGSLPIATLPPFPAVGRTGSLPVATLPPSLAVEAPSAPTVNNFTLQLMVLSKQSSADDMFTKYPALAPDIRVIRTIAKGKEKFILEYGSYSDTESANKAKQSLPFEFHRALVRKIAR